MTKNTIVKQNTKVKQKASKAPKYQELNDSELEVVCGGKCTSEDCAR